MMQFYWMVAAWVWMLLIGALMYIGYQRLPENWTEKIKGVKTKTLGVVVAVSPDVLNVLVLFQALGQQWVPDEKVTWGLRILGMVITTLRYITDKEQER